MIEDEPHVDSALLAALQTVQRLELRIARLERRARSEWAFLALGVALGVTLSTLTTIAGRRRLR